VQDLVVTHDTPAQLVLENLRGNRRTLKRLVAVSATVLLIVLLVLVLFGEYDGCFRGLAILFLGLGLLVVGAFAVDHRQVIVDSVQGTVVKQGLMLGGAYSRQIWRFADIKFIRVTDRDDSSAYAIARRIFDPPDETKPDFGGELFYRSPFIAVHRYDLEVVSNDLKSLTLNSSSSLEESKSLAAKVGLMVGKPVVVKLYPQVLN
jgi:hypothetical protein